MDQLWQGILIGAVVSIPLSIAANLITPRISGYFEAGNGRLKERNRIKAIETYQRRKVLLGDALKRDMHFVGLQTITMVGFFFVFLLLSGTAYLQLAPVAPTLKDWTLQAFALGVAAMIFFLVQYSFSMISDDAKALGDFPAYEKKLTDRFGPEVLKPPVEPAA